VSNPKVFEFAKEIGMTPLALMDKIKEWQIPVKNHMAELEPGVLEIIKTKLSGSDKVGSAEKPKKAAGVRKSSASKKSSSEGAPAAKKTATRSRTSTKAAAESAAAAATDSKTPVIRRKTKEVEPIVIDDGKAKVISRPEAVVEKVEAQVEEPVHEAPAAVVAAEAPAATVENTVPVTAAPVIPAAPVEKAAPAVSRKKEVSIGDSGVSSLTTVTPKRNIIGRMDLSRVQAPPGSHGGYSNNRPMTGGPRPASPGGAQPGGFNSRPPSGGGMAGNRTAGRNIRPGFVAQMPDPVAPPSEFDNKRELDKRAKKFGVSVAAPTGGLSAKEKEAEEILQSFNAVEFRKREMVFQPKKKTGLLNRVAMKTQITTPKASKRLLKVNGKMKVTDVANEMGLKAAQLTKALMTNGVMANMNTDLDFDTIALIVPEFGWEAQNVFKTADELAIATAHGDLDATKIIRPPVVTVMGHVDHGKTSLLDAIRNADVAKGEAGGITQHIGAYSVKTDDGSLVTFLDTPGHEAFTAMRSRGAQATDIVIIVVAADDGLMPQTAEAINHAKAAGVPMIIAVNKMDKPGANPDRIKQQLTEFEIVPEEWGGNTIFCEVSALKRTGIKELLENIKLLAEVAELKANPERSGTGIVIEAKLEKGKGPVATILVKDGSVAIGNFIVAGSMKGRIKSLMNDKGERVEKVGPGLPVEVLGLEGVPAAGDRIDVVADEKTSEQVSSTRRQQAIDAIGFAKKITLEDMFSKITQGDIKEFNIVLKADVHGSLEAVQGMLNKLTSAEVKNKIIHAAVGGVTENDVLLAHTSKGIVIGFNVRPDAKAQAKAKQIGVDVRTYSIVYEMVDEVRKAMTGLLAPQVIEKVMGTAEVRNIFTVPKMGVIAGCLVKNGKVQRSNMVRLVRNGKIVYEGKIGSLRRFKDDAKEVAEGFECGIGIENFNDIKVGDVIESFMKEEVAREMTPLK
jgi:translation initiation factor IF-2